MNIATQIIIILILFFLTGFTAVAEIAIIAVSRLRLRKLAGEGSRRARIIIKILESPEKFFSTILVINGLVTTLIASIVTVMTVSVIGGGRGIIIASVIASLAIIVCEVISKTVAASFSEKLALRVAHPINFFINLLSPVVKFLVKIANAAVLAFGGRAKSKEALVTEEEIRALMKIGEEDGVLLKEKYRMLSKVFDFSNTIVKNVMTFKNDIISIDVNMGLDDILEKVLESGYSRVPVYKDNPENIIGIINMKDLLNLSVNKGLVVLQDILYPAVKFSEAKKVSELLKEFQKGHTHMGIVTDDKGRLAGIVTLEDLLEEIVGEIEDEYDTRANYFREPDSR